MGTQFSKIKVTSRIEVHGQVYTQYAPGLELDYPVKSNSTNDLSEELYTRRAHHRQETLSVTFAVIHPPLCNSGCYVSRPDVDKPMKAI